MQTIDSINDSDNSSHTVITGTIEISLYVFKNTEPFFFIALATSTRIRGKQKARCRCLRFLEKLMDVQ